MHSRNLKDLAAQEISKDPNFRDAEKAQFMEAAIFSQSKIQSYLTEW